MNRMLRWPHDCAAICISTIIKLNRRSIILTWKKTLTPQQKAEYRAEKREEMQNLFKKIDDGVKAVFESESYKDCLRYMSKFTNYSAGNCILIMLQKPDASLVAAFGKWKELGRIINKGEKGIAILAPMSFKSKELKEQLVKDSSGNQGYNADGTEKKEKVEVEQTSIGFKKVYVFDVSQTSGETIPEYSSRRITVSQPPISSLLCLSIPVYTRLASS